jgi:hypothetical protein
VILTMVVFMGVLMISCLMGVAVIPSFDRKLAFASQRRASASRSV